MAVSKEVLTYGLLNAWQAVVLEDIWYFNQARGTGAPSSECGVYIQTDREQVARALSRAWQKFATHLGYFPRPVWTSEIIPLRRGVPWERQTLRTTYGYVEAFGQRAVTLIDDDAAIVFSDADSDGVDDTATITVTTAVDPSEIQIFFRQVDGAPTAGNELYQIEPVLIRAGTVAGTVDIIGHRALFVQPSTIWNVPYSPSSASKITRNEANTTNAANFVTHVDVYRVYNDTTTPLEVIADPIFSRATGLDGNILTTGVARLIDSQIGSFMPRPDEDCGVGYAESVRVYYQAGYPLQLGDMDYDLKESLIRLANTLMPRRLCTFCTQTREVWEEDRENAEIAAQDLSAVNPFGIKKGQFYAWQTVADRALGQGGKW